MTYLTYKLDSIFYQKMVLYVIISTLLIEFLGKKKRQKNTLYSIQRIKSKYSFVFNNYYLYINNVTKHIYLAYNAINYKTHGNT